MPWWGYLTVVALIVAALVLFVRRRQTPDVYRQELRDYLVANVDQLTILEETRTEFIYEIAGQEGTVYLHNIMNELSDVKWGGSAKRQAVYERVARMLTEGEVDEPLSLESHGERILPRLKPQVFFEQLPETRKAVRSQLTGTGLCVGYVIDSETSVRYLIQEDLSELRLSIDQLHEVALANLRDRFPRDVVRQVVDSDELVSFKALDSYDATRALLVPEYLEDGEELALVIPDRDTLVLTGVPDDGDWSGLEEIARMPESSRVVLDRPLLVTRNGFELK